MVPISPAAKKGTLTLFPEEGKPEVCDLDFGALQPIDMDEGVRMRLQNLGYELKDEIRRALSSNPRSAGSRRSRICR